MTHASRLTRLFGQFLDGVVAAIPVVVAAFLAPAIGPLALLLILPAALWAIGYIFLSDGMAGGQSIGKRWLGLAVIDADTGRPCTYSQSLVRNVMLSFLGPIDWIFIFGERCQRLGDKVAGTYVVEAGS